MNYNPQIHPRRSIRLKEYDYSQAGAYFITICCYKQECRFGEIVGDEPESAEMILNECGQIAHDEWIKLPEHFANIELDVFQIMPNHMHGIILVYDTIERLYPPHTTSDENVGAGFTPALVPDTPIEMNKSQSAVHNIKADGIGKRARVNSAPTVGDVVGAYKSLVANRCLDIYKLRNEGMGKLWQRNFFEHIIRNEKSYHTISNYIINNPTKWKEDKFYKP